MKKLFLVCVALMLILCAVCVAVAESVYVSAEAMVEHVALDEDGDSEAALEGFIRREFGLPVATPRSTYGLTLGVNSTEYRLYLKLAQFVQSVARGEVSNTVFTVPFSELFDKISYTADELGVDAIVVDGAIGQDAQVAFVSQFNVDISKVIDALLVDYPFDLFWFDKAKGYSAGGMSMSAYPDEIFVSDGAVYTVSFRVNQEYALSKSQGTTGFDVSVVQLVNNAAVRAKQIVSAYAGKSDVDKLRMYKNKICDLVSYNHAAADDDTTPYGNPWQVIWVFDDDPETNVVCEGYAKAFQWLCDLSTFHTNVSSIIVSGDMYGGTGAGAHMWNLVRMGNGEHYLVDVTNCDDGSIGAPDQLFMVGYAGLASKRLSSSDGSDVLGYYYIANGHEIIYAYDEDTVNLYRAEDITVAQYPFSNNDDPDAFISSEIAYTMYPENPSVNDYVTITLDQVYDRIKVIRLRDGKPLYGGNGEKDYFDVDSFTETYTNGYYLFCIEAYKDETWYYATIEFTVLSTESNLDHQELVVSVYPNQTIGDITFDYTVGDGFDQVRYELLIQDMVNSTNTVVDSGTLSSAAGQYSYTVQAHQIGNYSVVLYGEENGENVKDCEAYFFTLFPLTIIPKTATVQVGELAHFDYEIPSSLYGNRAFVYPVIGFDDQRIQISAYEQPIMLDEVGGSFSVKAETGKSISIFTGYYDLNGEKYPLAPTDIIVEIEGDNYTYTADVEFDKTRVLNGEDIYVSYDIEDTNEIVMRQIEIVCFNMNTYNIERLAFDLDNAKGEFVIHPTEYSIFVDLPYTYVRVSFQNKAGVNYMDTMAAQLEIISPDLYLPSDLTTIESQAFQNIGAQKVYIPAAVTSIADDAFDSNAIIICKANSYAKSWAEDHGYHSQLVD